MSEPIENPYKKGKSKLIASFMLEGWSNDKIFNHIHDNKLDQQFSNPVVMENIYQVRTKFNQLGLTDKMREKEQLSKTNPSCQKRLKTMVPPLSCMILSYTEKLRIPMERTSASIHPWADLSGIFSQQSR